MGDLEHILVVCPALQSARERLTKLWLDKSAQSPGLHQMIQMVLKSPPSIQVQFILDPTVFDGISMLVECHGLPILLHVLYLTRTYAYYMNREKLIQLGRWPGDFGRKQKPVAQIRAQKVKKVQTINDFLVPGSDVYPTALNIDRGQVYSTSDLPSYQADLGCTTHHTTDQLTALPGNDNSTRSDLLVTGHSSVPIGVDQVLASLTVGGEGQGRVDVRQGCDTVHIIPSIIIS